MGPVFSHNAEFRCTRSVVLIKIYPLRHGESFHPLLLLFLFDWLLKRWEITKVMLINCNSFYLLRYASGQMHMKMIYISEPTVKIIKYNVNIAVYWLKSQTISHGDFMHVFLAQPPVKSLPSVCDVKSFSPCSYWFSLTARWL